MATSSASASKLLNIRNSALHNLIRRHLLHHSAAAVATSKNLIPSISNQLLNLFLLRTGGVKLHGHSSTANSPLWSPLGSSLMRIEGARTYATNDDQGFEDPDGVEYSCDDDDDLDNYSGSDFDDEDEYEDPDEDPDIK